MYTETDEISDEVLLATRRYNAMTCRDDTRGYPRLPSRAWEAIADRLRAAALLVTGDHRVMQPVMQQRPVRPALVVRCGGRVPTRDTVPIVYQIDGDRAAWYAELRAKQAAR